MATVAELMTRDAVSISPNATVRDILRLWEYHGVPAFPVVEGDRVIGIVTEGDLVRKESAIRGPAVFALLDALIPIGAGRHLEEDLLKHVGYRARDLMTSPAVTVRPDMDVSDAARVMVERRVKTLLVVDSERRLLGVLTRRDLLCHLAATLR